MPDGAHRATPSFFEVTARGSQVGVDYMYPVCLPLSCGKWAEGALGARVTRKG